jgi:hypothetical protein
MTSPGPFATPGRAVRRWAVACAGLLVYVLFRRAVRLDDAVDWVLWLELSSLAALLTFLAWNYTRPGQGADGRRHH